MRVESQVGRVARPSQSVADVTGQTWAAGARLSRAFHTMVDFGGFPESPAGVGATVALDALEKLPVIGRGRPQAPRHHAGGMPGGV
jgi:hypothetical protein